MDSTDEGPGPMKQLEKNSNYNTALTLIVHHIFLLNIALLKKLYWSIYIYNFETINIVSLECML